MRGRPGRDGRPRPRTSPATRSPRPSAAARRRAPARDGPRAASRDPELDLLDPAVAGDVVDGDLERERPRAAVDVAAAEPLALLDHAPGVAVADPHLAHPRALAVPRLDHHAQRSPGTAGADDAHPKRRRDVVEAHEARDARRLLAAQVDRDHLVPDRPPRAETPDGDHRGAGRL